LGRMSTTLTYDLENTHECHTHADARVTVWIWWSQIRTHTVKAFVGLVLVGPIDTITVSNRNAPPITYTVSHFYVRLPHFHVFNRIHFQRLNLSIFYNILLVLQWLLTQLETTDKNEDLKSTEMRDGICYQHRAGQFKITVNGAPGAFSGSGNLRRRSERSFDVVGCKTGPIVADSLDVACDDYP
jgi:hypothetical protein